MTEKIADRLIGFLIGAAFIGALAYAGMAFGWPHSLRSCLREVKRLDAGWSAEAHDYDQCNRERIWCRAAIVAGHKDGYQTKLLLDSDSEPPQLCWYGYCWDYEPEAY